MNYIKNVLFIILILISGSAYSQTMWSLEDCVAYAIEHNLNLKDFKYSRDTGKETYRQAVRSLLPNINANSNYNIRYGRSVDPNNNSIVNTDFFSNNYSLDSSIDLFQGFQKLNAIKASKFLYQATQEEVFQQKYLLAFRVMSAFYDIQFMQGLLTIAQEQEQVSQDNYNLVKRQVELGQKAGADLYEAESTLLTDKLLVTQSKNNLEAANLVLIQEMNLQGASSISIQTTGAETIDETEISQMHQDSIYNKATQFVPIIKAQELRAKAAKKEVAVARGDLYPSLSFFAGYGTGYFETTINEDTGETIPFNTQITDNASQYIGLTLNIPISNGWSARSKVKQQKVALQRANNNLDLQKQELYQLIQQLVQEGNALKTEAEQSAQKKEAQGLSFKIAQKKYEKGLISAIELYQSKNLLANAQNENLQVRLRLKVNESTLAFYRGLPVFNINRTY